MCPMVFTRAVFSCRGRCRELLQKSSLLGGCDGAASQGQQWQDELTLATAAPEESPFVVVLRQIGADDFCVKCLMTKMFF